MKRLANIPTVIKGFKDGFLKDGENSTGSVYFRGDKLSCWLGDLAYRIDGRFWKKEKRLVSWFLLNADSLGTYHPSQGHINYNQYTYQVFQDMPRISFECMRSAGILGAALNNKLILIDFEEDYHAGLGKDYVDYNQKVWEIFEQRQPVGAEITYRYDKDGNIDEKRAHRVGTVVIAVEIKDDQYNVKREYYLCAMDRFQYFISKLARKVKTVTEAWATLTPKLISELKSKNIPIQRQGEWYFFKYTEQLDGSLPKYVHKAINGLLIKDYERRLTLPRWTDASNPHIITRGKVEKKYILGWGVLRHPEHGMLKLVREAHGRPWVGLRNLSLGDWSTKAGRVD